MNFSVPKKGIINITNQLCMTNITVLSVSLIVLLNNVLILSPSSQYCKKPKKQLQSTVIDQIIHNTAKLQNYRILPKILLIRCPDKITVQHTVVHFVSLISRLHHSHHEY